MNELPTQFEWANLHRKQIFSCGMKKREFFIFATSKAHQNIWLSLITSKSNDLLMWSILYKQSIVRQAVHAIVSCCLSHSQWVVQMIEHSSTFVSCDSLNITINAIDFWINVKHRVKQVATFTRAKEYLSFIERKQITLLKQMDKLYSKLYQFFEE